LKQQRCLSLSQPSAGNQPSAGKLTFCSGALFLYGSGGVKVHELIDKKLNVNYEK
jgi:hypothetical protein